MNWKQLTGTVKRRFGRLLDGQLDLWAGKRQSPKPVARRPSHKPPISHTLKRNQS
jgi:hypothetical protein